MKSLCMMRWVIGVGLMAWLPVATKVAAWDYEGHRLVNQLALDSLPNDFPKFARTPEARERIAFLGGEADRWRNSTDLSFKHASSPDHYFDFEELDLYGMDAKTLSPFRYEFAAQLALSRAANRDKLPPIDPLKNSDRTREWIGFLPWAIVEQQAKLQSAFSYLKALEQYGGTREEIANAQQNIVYLMGVMGHFVADGSQPLHTSVHHHGWVGANPNRYPTNSGIHQWIDGGFIKRADIKAADLAPRMRPARPALAPDASPAQTNLFPLMVAWLVEQNRQVEPLYKLERDGKLSGREAVVPPEGRTFVCDQLSRGAQLLGDLWLTAWQQAPEDTFLRGVLLKRGAPNGSSPAK